MLDDVSQPVFVVIVILAGNTCTLSPLLASKIGLTDQVTIMTRDY